VTSKARSLRIRGAKELIAKHLPTVICEINPWFLEGFGVQLEELTGFFFDQGYQLLFLPPGQWPGALASGGRSRTSWKTTMSSYIRADSIASHRF